MDQPYKRENTNTTKKNDMSRLEEKRNGKRR